MAEAADVAAFQLSRFLHESGEIWRYVINPGGGAAGWLGAELDKLFAVAPFLDTRNDKRVAKILDGKRLMRLSRLMFAALDDIETEHTAPNERRLQESFRVGEASCEWHVNELKLAHVLSLAAAMALDARRLPAVIAEHVGIAEHFNAETIRKTLSDVEWRKDDTGLSLGLECPHEALDAALEDVVHDLERHRRSLERDPAAEAFVGSLPTEFNLKELRPVTDDDLPRYQRPHVRLRLDHGRVQELLMGKNLYGSPELALRELYQNAMDACRYRRARETYLRRTGKVDEATPPYVGRIVFTAGTEAGRPYVECSDNGIGMAERHLISLFAKAGSRFVDSHEFHLEKAAWEEAGIPFYANSRFGIGVFSYFMIAEEILIESRRMREDGAGVEDGLRAAIVGSGSLFRVQPFNGRPYGGTRVRLFLSDVEQTPAGLLRTVRDWLWIPEFETVLKSPGEPDQVLVANTPTPKMLEVVREAVPIPSGADASGNPRFYWTLGPLPLLETHYWLLPGHLLCDGILLSERAEQEDQEEADQLLLKGVTVNLKEELAPELSVDRRHAVSWPNGYAALEKALTEEGAQAFLRYPGLTMGRLALLLNAHPMVGTTLDRMLRNDRVETPPIPLAGTYPHEVSPLGLGISLTDTSIAEMLGRAVDSRELWRWSSTRIRLRLRALYEWKLPVPDCFAWLATFDARAALRDLRAAQEWLHFRYTDILEREGRLGVSRALLVDPEAAAVVALHLAAALNVSLGSIRSMIDETKDGALLPALEPLDFRPSAAHMKLLTRDLDGKHPLVFEITVAHLLLASADLYKTIGSVVDLAKPLAQAGVRVCVLDHLPRNIRISPLQRRLLRGGVYTRDAGYPSELTHRITLGKVVRIGADSGMGEVIEAARSLADLGIPVAPLDRLPPTARPTARQVELVSFNAETDFADHNQITAPQILWRSIKWNASVGETCDVAASVAGWGFDVPDLDKLPRNARLSRRQIDLLDDSYGPASVPWNDELTPGLIVRMAARWNTSLGEVLDIAASLAEYGVSSSGLTALPREFKPTGRHADMLSLYVDGKAPWITQTTLKQLLRAAQSWGTSLGEVWELAKPIAAFLGGVTSIPPEALDIGLDHREERLIRSALRRQTPGIDAWDVAQAAHQLRLHPSAFADAIQRLATIIDVGDALEYVRFCPPEAEAIGRAGAPS